MDDDEARDRIGAEDFVELTTCRGTQPDVRAAHCARADDGRPRARRAHFNERLPQVRVIPIDEFDQAQLL